MTPGKVPCPACGRTVAVLAAGGVRRHKNVATGDWCPGVPPDDGAAAAGVVVSFRRQPRPRIAAGLTPEEVAAENTARTPSKALDRSGLGSCGSRSLTRGKEGRCKQARGQGTDHVGFGHCRKHGGSTTNGKRYAALERARAEVHRVRQGMTFYGRRVAVDPEQALLEELQRTKGVIDWLESVLSTWGQDETLEAEMVLLAPESTEQELRRALEHLGRPVPLELAALDPDRGPDLAGGVDDRTGLPSLIAVHSTDKALGFTDTEQAAWLKVYREERKHYVATAKACVDADIAERRTTVLEARGAMIRGLVLHALRIAGVTLPENRQLEIVGEATRIVALEVDQESGIG